MQLLHRYSGGVSAATLRQEVCYWPEHQVKVKKKAYKKRKLMQPSHLGIRKMQYRIFLCGVYTVYAYIIRPWRL